MIFSLLFRHVRYKTGIQIIPGTKIGYGVHFVHFGDVVINSSAIIGENCTIFNGVTVGSSYLGGKAAIIGNDVTLCAGAKIIGDIKIGNNVIVGAGSVVTKDIPDDAIVVGNPAKIISLEGHLRKSKWGYFDY